MQLFSAEVNMADNQTQSIERDKFLTMAVNILHRAFIEAPRTDAKNLFKQVAEGKAVPLTKVEMEDKSVVRFDLALDHSEYPGTLNYSAFRTSLATTLGNLVNALQNKQNIPSFTAQNQPNNQIIGITGVTVEDDVASVMVLSVQTADREAAVLLRPMYLDYDQFQRSQQQAEGGESTA
ncbi:hypothetical protein A3709_16920 [Halioglobus sp. HI00S01]|nr:hypothetical protein A3709_16920 [Halioglobus sp. HI00S01]